MNDIGTALLGWGIGQFLGAGLIWAGVLAHEKYVSWSDRREFNEIERLCRTGKILDEYYGALGFWVDKTRTTNPSEMRQEKHR